MHTSVMESSGQVEKSEEDHRWMAGGWQVDGRWMAGGSWRIASRWLVES